MRLRPHPVLMSLALTLLAGCAGDTRTREYYDAVETDPLDIPEGLARPTSSAALVINAPAMPLSPMAMESKPPRVSSTTSGVDDNARFKWSAQGPYLLVDDSPESVQRRLRLVLERAGMQRVSVDEQGVCHFFYTHTPVDEDEGFFSKLAFWRRDDLRDYSGAYQAYIEPDGDQTRVYVRNADGTTSEPDAAEHILDVVRSRLG